MDSIPGVLGIGEQLALLMDRDMTFAADGSFTITIDSDPADGRPNHIQSTPAAKVLFIRDTLSDWATSDPRRIEHRAHWRTANAKTDRAADDRRGGHLGAGLRALLE